jgi:hypothetical protein
MNTLRMSLLENSESFFHEALLKAVQAESHPDKWKFAILLLVQAIETSLKERLRRTQEILIYSNIDKPKHTVDLRLAIDRLEKISKVDFKVSDKKYINTASELRNQIVHFEFDLSIEQIKSNFVSLVGFYSSFCQAQLNTDMVNNLPEDLHEELLNLDSYVDELEARAEERIKKEDIDPDHVWECPACNKFTFVIEDGTDSCYVCGYEEPVYECEGCSSFVLEEYIEDVDCGNMKGLENWKKICKDCIDKSEHQEDWYHHYYE